jgi:hypothetical protein
LLFSEGVLKRRPPGDRSLRCARHPWEQDETKARAVPTMLLVES